MDSEREKEFLEVVAVFPDDPLTRFGLANFYRDENENAKAVEQYRKAIEIDPGYGAAYLELGQLLEQSSDIDAARSVYERAISEAEKKGDEHIVNRARMRLDDL